jgi:hypothetical protein
LLFNWWLSLQPLAQAGFSLADFSTLKMEAIHSSETSVHTRYTRRHSPEDGIIHAYTLCTKYALYVDNCKDVDLAEFLGYIRQVSCRQNLYSDNKLFTKIK